jgi:predicted dehydrogenase
LVRKFTSAIIGLGQIGQGYDYDWPDKSRSITHATGFTHHESFELIGGVDPNPVARKRFEKKFSRPAYTDINTLLAQAQPEIISIAVPTDLHLSVFQEIIGSRPRAIICEKPIASSLKGALKIVALAEKYDCALLVNYMRRFEPGVLSLKKAINQGEFGDIFKGIVWYSKGLLNNGSHFIDLLIYLLGDVSGQEIIGAGRKWDNHDPEADIRICFGNTTVYFLSAHEEYYSLNDIRLMGTKGEIYYAEGGNEIRIRKTQPHPDYPGYYILNPNHDIIYNDLKRYQWHVLEHLKNHLIDGIPLNSDGKTAVSTLKVIEKVYSFL